MPNGKQFKMSGMSQAKRELTELYEGCIWPKAFPLGMQVTYRYRELTAAGIPSEARYWRDA
jgi:hypothetical protein